MIPQLVKITFDACPDCNCRDIGKVQIGNGHGSHTCGEWREFITFSCGSEYEYSPNFSRIVCNHPCNKQGYSKVEVDVSVRLTLRIRNEAMDGEFDPTSLVAVPDNWYWKPRDGVRYKGNIPGSITDVKTLRVKQRKTK